MIEYKEVEKMDRCDAAYLFTICSMRLYRRTIEKVTLYGKSNAKGRYVASIGIYFSDPSNNTHTLCFKLYDEEYIWFLNSLAHDFPEVPLEDLTEKKQKSVNAKGGEKNDVQTGTEA